MSLTSALPLLTLAAVVGALLYSKRHNKNTPASNNTSLELNRSVNGSSITPSSAKLWIKYIAACIAILVIYVGVNSSNNKSSTYSNEIPQVMGGKEITQRCALEAGIPEHDPSHRISPAEFAVMGACVERMVAAEKLKR